MGETIERTYFFENIEELISHIFSKREHVSVLRLQKTLYLLFAYYGATYGSIDNHENSEFESFPKYLFNAEFEAWQYGPVIYDVYCAHKREEYKADSIECEKPERKDVMVFIDEIIEKINTMSDFSLVDRTHQDIAWNSVYIDGQQRTPMNREKIIEEYKNKYVG